MKTDNITNIAMAITGVVIGELGPEPLEVMGFSLNELQADLREKQDDITRSLDLIHPDEHHAFLMAIHGQSAVILRAFWSPECPVGLEELLRRAAVAAYIPVHGLVSPDIMKSLYLTEADLPADVNDFINLLEEAS